MRNIKKKYHVMLALISIFFIASCSTVRYVTPQVVKTDIKLNTLPANATKIEVVDYRLDKHTDDVCTALYNQLMLLLSPENGSFAPSDHTHTLIVDVIGYKAFFTPGTWHGEMNVNVRLVQEPNKKLGSWTIAEKSEQYNMLGYGTAKKVSQEVYEKTVQNLASLINAVSIDE